MSMRRSRLLFKYFAYYTVVMLVIVLAVGLTSYGFIRRSVTKNAIDSERSLLNSFARTNESTLEEISNLAFTASTENDFVPHITTNLQENADTIMGKLRSYIVANNYITDLFLISPNYKYIYSPGTTYTMDRFLRYKLGDGVTADEFNQILQRIREPEFPQEINRAGSDNVMCVTTIPAYDPSPYAYLLFEIPRKNLAALAKQFLTENDQVMMIADDSQVIACSTNAAPEEYKRISGQIGQARDKAGADGYTQFDIGGVRYLFMLQKSALFGWNYIRISTYTHVLRPVQNVLTWFVNILAFSIFIGSVLVYVLSYINYSPIRKLNDLAQRRLGSAPAASGDELSSLEKLVNEAGNNIGRLQKNMENYQPALKHLFVMTLIKGLGDPKSVSLLQNPNFTMLPSNFFVVIFHVHRTPGEAADILEDISDYIDSHLPGGMVGYSTQSIMDSKIITVLSTATSNAPEIKEEINSLKCRINDGFSASVTAGMGGVKAEMRNISNSFLEAATALDYQFILGRNITISFYDLNIDSYSDINYPHELMRVLLSDLNFGREDRVLTDIRQLMDYIRNNSHSMHIARLICYDVTNDMVKTLKQLNVDTRGISANIDPISVTQFETLEELGRVLTEFCRSICRRVSDGTQTPLHLKAVSYIRRNSPSLTFSVNEMAESLGVSAAHLSRTFRENVGETIVDYVKNYKIEQAKQFLTQTDRPISTIVSDLGYCDVSSFIRTFKNMVGITPGEYRANMKAAPVPKNRRQ